MFIYSNYWSNYWTFGVAYCNFEIVCVAIGDPAFCLALDLAGVHFRRKLKHVGHVGEQKIKYWPIKTLEIAGFRF